MADLNYTARVDVSQAEASLARLQKGVSGLNDTFLKLKTALAAVSLTALISDSLKYADAISDLSDVSEIAIGNIIGFSKAVEANGGSADGAQKAILRLVNSIGEAADGSAALQQAFRDVGVTIEDLRTSSNQDILKKTIDGLDKMENSAKRSVLVTQLLGKEFRNVATGQLGAAYAEATAKSAQYADAIKKGADAQQNIDRTIGEFKIGLLEAIKPFSELVSKIDVGIETFQKFVQAILAVGVAILTWTILGRVWTALRALYLVIAELVVAAGGLAELFGNLINGFGAIWRATEGAGGAFSRLLLSVRAVGAAIMEVLAPAFEALKPIAMPVLMAIAGAWGYIQESTSDAIDKLRDYASALSFGLIDPSKKDDGSAAKKKKEAEDAIANAKTLRDVIDRQAEAYAKAALATEHYVDLMAIGLSRQTEAIAFEATMIKMGMGKNAISKEEIEIYKAQNDAQIQGLAKIKDLEQQREKLGVQLKFAKDEEKASINAQLGQLGIQISKTEEYYKGHDEGLKHYLEQLQAVKILDEARKKNIDAENISTMEQLDRAVNLRDTLRTLNEQKMGVNFEATQVGKGTLAKQFDKIKEDARVASEASQRAFSEMFGGGELTPEKSQERADGLKKIADAYEEISAAQTANVESSRTWAAGWGEAMADYQDNASNAALQAKTYFDTFTKGAEDAMVRFAQTGKLNFADLANSIIADMIRIETRRAIAGMMGGTGGLFSGITSLFGFANGGEPPVGVPSMVGERGPELFVPKSAGTIVPNSALGGQTIVNNQYITNQVSAIDAKGVAQLFYENRQTLFGTVEKARKELPMRQGQMV